MSVHKVAFLISAEQPHDDSSGDSISYLTSSRPLQGVLLVFLLWSGAIIAEGFLASRTRADRVPRRFCRSGCNKFDTGKHAGLVEGAAVHIKWRQTRITCEVAGNPIPREPQIIRV